MRFLIRLLVAAAFLVPFASQATQQWSTCQTITGVSNYIAYGSSVILALSPGISGCNAVDLPGAMAFAINVGGVTADNINSFLAESLAAYLSGHQVTIYYDNATSSCFGTIISVGGVGGQCP